MSFALVDKFFAMLRYALGAETSPITEPLTAEQWKVIFSLSKKQSLLGVIYSGIKRLPAELQPPADLMQQWTLIARRIMATNSLMNATPARLTQIFEERGRKTVILKGLANALLYPDPYMRQADDIDILVEGGRESVIKLLNDMGVMEGKDFFELSNLHAHVDSGKFGNGLPSGVTVEIHFAPSNNNSPFTTRSMCRFLEQESSKLGAVSLSHVGFYAPPITFALVMQLSHILRHFYDEGVGLRQIVDYHQLLRQSSENNRALVCDNLNKVGLRHIAGAVMWVMIF